MYLQLKYVINVTSLLEDVLTKAAINGKYTYNPFQPVFSSTFFPYFAQFLAISILCSIINHLSHSPSSRSLSFSFLSSQKLMLLLLLYSFSSSSSSSSLEATFSGNCLYMLFLFLSSFSIFYCIFPCLILLLRLTSYSFHTDRFVSS